MARRTFSVQTMWRCPTWACSILLAGLGGCTDVDASGPGTVFACSKPADCLSGYACVCGWCQRKGFEQPSLCTEDTTSDTSTGTDTAVGTDSTTGTDATSGTDAVVQPDIPGGCDLITWAGCAAGKGCYYTSGKKACATYGSDEYEDSCDPKSTTDCGRGLVDGADRPLLCDTVDKKCYPTCDCDVGNSGCPAKMVCYCLTDSNNKEYPDGAGICAP
jgi:hypothetical protein